MLFRLSLRPNIPYIDGTTQEIMSGYPRKMFTICNALKELPSLLSVPFANMSSTSYQHQQILIYIIRPGLDRMTKHSRPLIPERSSAVSKPLLK